MPKKQADQKVTRKGGRPYSKPFPPSTFQDALVLADALQKFGAGKKMRRLTLFEKMKKSPDSGSSRHLVINSGRYGLTKGGYKAEHIELTPQGAAATDPEATPADRITARFNLAIASVEPFNALYEVYKNNRVPAREVLQDTAREHNVAASHAEECVDTFLLNATFLTLIRTMTGSDRLLPIEHVLEELPPAEVIPKTSGPAVEGEVPVDKGAGTGKAVSWDKVCFYISPIGDEGAPERDHADFFLTQLIEPALKESGLELIRADHIGKPGMITAQVIEHIVKSRLAIADLSFHNPNVFYELSLRHVCRLPTVQVIRAEDKIPFDLDQFRTIRIDTRSVYALYPKIETHRAEIANQIRKALSDPEDVDNPITAFCPALAVSIPK